MKLPALALFLIVSGLAARTPPNFVDELAAGAELHYSRPTDFCAGGPPSAERTDRPRGATFAEWVGAEIAGALHSGGSWRVQLRRVEHRNSSRWRNLTAVAAGAIMNDPGWYSLEFAVVDRRTDAEIAVVKLEARPSLRGLLLGNSCSRASASRRNARRQVRALARSWEAKRVACQTLGAEQTRQ